MKRVLAIYFFAIILVIFGSCAGSRNSPGPTVVRDGKTFEKAIVVKSVDAEYEWIRSNFPGSQVTGQSLLSKKRKYCDLLTFKTKDGEDKQVYFDISGFYGRF
jgi:hypothetical protein